MKQTEPKSISELLRNYSKPSTPASLYEDNLYGKDKRGLAYLVKKRCLKLSTLQNFHIGYTKNGEIAIPVFKEGELIDYKFRSIEEKSFRRHPNSETWCFNDGAFLSLQDDKYIIIAEGELEVLTFWQMGFKNVISGTGGVQAKTPWINKIPNNVKVYIALDNDEPGQEAAQELSERIGIDRCYNVKYTKKDANEMLVSGATSSDFQKLLDNAEKFRVKDIFRIDEVIDNLKKNKVQKVNVFSDRITAHLNGGVPKQGVVTISGKPKVGKSSYLTNILIRHADKGLPVLLISLENDLYLTIQRILETKLKKPYKSFTEEDWDFVKNSMKDYPFYIDTSMGSYNMERVEGIVSQMKKSYGIEVFGFDHLGYLAGEDAKDIESTMKGLKMMSRNNNVITYVIVHVNRSYDEGDYITSDHLKGSSAMAQESNIVFILNDTKAGMEVNIDMSRMSRSKLRVPIIFDGESGLMTDDLDRSVKHYDEEVEDVIEEVKIIDY